MLLANLMQTTPSRAKSGLDHFSGFLASRPGQAGVVFVQDRYGNDLIINRDFAGNVTKIISSNGRWIEFTNDTVNNRITQATDNIGRTYGYIYDASGRLWKVTDPENGVTEYLYDSNHNMTSVINPRGHTVMVNEYDANNRQLTFGDKTLAYDDNGNLQSITDSNGTTLYSWNARNQLVGISGPTVNASFVYDGVGRREEKINGSLTEFLYDGVNPVQESSGATVLANILPGLGIDEFLTRTEVVAGATSNFLTGALGSPVAVTDNTGAVQTEYTYESYGRTTETGALEARVGPVYVHVFSEFFG